MTVTNLYLTETEKSVFELIFLGHHYFINHFKCSDNLVQLFPKCILTNSAIHGNVQPSIYHNSFLEDASYLS